MIRLVTGMIMIFGSIGSMEMTEIFPASNAEYIVWLFGTGIACWGGISLAEKDRLANPL